MLNKRYSQLQSGFTYIGILMLMVLMSISMAGVGLVWHIQLQREKERQLLLIGNTIRKAIGSYYANSPSDTGKYPPTLEALLLDERKIVPKRHIRKIYKDPIGQQQEWVLIMQNKGVVGIHSQSTLKPFRISGFPEAYEAFSKAKSYQDWKFVYVPGID
jgi:type II secretory pathway pseudopilin PulG